MAQLIKPSKAIATQAVSREPSQPQTSPTAPAEPVHSNHSSRVLPLMRNSERSDFKRCPQRWYWRYIEHLVPANVTSGPLLFGSLGHLALAEYYIPGRKRGPHPAETWGTIAKDMWDNIRVEQYIDDEMEVTWEEAKQLGHNMLVNYVNHYGSDGNWEVLWVEEPFAQRIPHPFDLAAKKKDPRAIIKYVGTIDLIVRNLETGLVEFVDHKFMKTIMTDHLYLDDQNGGYLSVATHELRKRGILKDKEAVSVLTYNFLRKANPPDRPQNAEGKYTNLPEKRHYIEALTRAGLAADDKMTVAVLKQASDKLGLKVVGEASKVQPAPFFHRERIQRTTAERNTQIKRIAQEAFVIQQYRTGKLPIFKTPTSACSWDCSFFDLCQTDESGGDTNFVKQNVFKLEDPYKEYYEGAESPKRLVAHEEPVAASKHPVKRVAPSR